jgi:hypothetical protein
MARIENQPKVILTQEERETLRKAQSIFNELDAEDKNCDIFNQCDNFDSEWCWVDNFIETLVNISEVE